MRHRTLTALLLAPMLILASVLLAEAIFGTISGAIQRAKMIVNQVTQISNQVRQLRTEARQLSGLEEQLDHLERAARGEVDALAEPLTDLAAGPGSRDRKLTPRRDVMKRAKDAGLEYAEIWGETVQANRRLRTLSPVLAGACLT